MRTAVKPRPRVQGRQSAPYDMGPAGARHPISSQEARALAALLREHNRLARLSLPQSYTQDMVADRFPGISIERIKRLCTAHLGYQPRRGQAFYLTLTQLEHLCDLVAAGGLEGAS